MDPTSGKVGTYSRRMRERRTWIRQMTRWGLRADGWGEVVCNRGKSCSIHEIVVEDMVMCLRNKKKLLQEGEGRGSVGGL